MSLAAERAYFEGDHCQHVAARDEHKRLERLSPRRARHQWTEEPPVPDYVPTFTLDRQIAEWRSEVSEERYRQLQREWPA